MSSNDEVEWNRVVDESEEGMIYHSTEWLSDVQRSNPAKFHPLHLLIEDGSGEVVAVFPLFLDKRFLMNDAESIPYCSFGGPCFAPGQFDSGVLDEFLRRIDGLSRDLGICNMKIHPSAFEDSSRLDRQYLSYGFEIRADFTEFILPLEFSGQIVWERLDKKIRNSIRKAIKSGVEVTIAKDRRELVKFYDMYSDFCRRKHIGVKPFSFFEFLWGSLFPKHLRLLLANYEGELVSGMMMLADKGVVHYWCSSSRPEHTNLNSNDLLLWHTVEWAIENGYRMLDLGCCNRAELGVYRFKEKWGSRRVSLHRRFKEYPDRNYLSHTKRLLRSLLLDVVNSFTD